MLYNSFLVRYHSHTRYLSRRKFHRPILGHHWGYLFFKNPTNPNNSLHDVGKCLEENTKPKDFSRLTQEQKQLADFVKVNGKKKISEIILIKRLGNMVKLAKCLCTVNWNFFTRTKL